MAKKYLVFLPLLLFQIWLAHAVCFFAHEFSHSIVAWALGWKANPLALHYPPFSITILFAQFGINENVDYQPIFAAGHGWHAGIIASAGMVIGNMLLTYPLSRWLYRVAKRRKAYNWGLLFYLTTVASLGNFWDYVPIRTFATEGDMYTIAQGFGCSPWLILLVLGTPTVVALVYFFYKTPSSTLLYLFPHSAAKRATIIVFTTLGIFAFYGAAGWIDYCGPESKWLSITSVFALFPAMTVYGFWRVKRVRLVGGML